MEAEAEEGRILELIRHTDRIAEIHNSLRLGTAVALEEPRGIPVRPPPVPRPP